MSQAMVSTCIGPRDARVIELWLAGRSPHTQAAYRRDIHALLAFVRKPLHLITLDDLVAFARAIADRGYRPTSQARILSAVKSLFAWAHEAGYLPLNPAKAMRVPKARDDLAARILPPEAIQRMIALEPYPRNRVLLMLLYYSGGRVSEIAALRWADVQPRGDRGQVTLYGKGGKTRVVPLPAGAWQALIALRGGAPDDAPVFVSRKHHPLTRPQIFRIVRAAAKRAGIDKPVSPHWLRHAHCSHAIERGAPITLVAQTVGHASINTTQRYVHHQPENGSSLYL